MKTKEQTKPGYQHTKLGWIPEEWMAKSVDKVFTFLHTNSYSRNQMQDEPSENAVYNIHYGDIHATYKTPIIDFEVDSIPLLKDEINLSNNVSFLKNGDLIIADASEDYEGVGDAKEIKNIKDKKAVAGLHTFALRDKGNFSADGFRPYIFKHPKVRNRLKVIATGSKVYGISKSNIQSFDIILPPLPEQQKIADILSTWDTAIGQQQALIAAKQQYKKGLMQNLLTGKKRFPGFTDEWKEVKLGEVAECFSGGTPLRNKPEYYSGNIPWIKSGELNQFEIWETEEHISDEAVASSSAKLVEKDTLLLALYGATAGVVSITRISATINQAILAINLSDSVDKYYLYFELKRRMPKIVENMVQGGQPNLSGGIVKRIKLTLPSLPEQQKIAGVLSAADAEIEKLKTQLTALQAQKKGLMQKLLSGEVRTVSAYIKKIHAK